MSLAHWENAVVTQSQGRPPSMGRWMGASLSFTEVGMLTNALLCDVGVLYFF